MLSFIVEKLTGCSESQESRQVLGLADSDTAKRTLQTVVHQEHLF